MQCTADQIKSFCDAFAFHSWSIRARVVIIVIIHYSRALEFSVYVAARIVYACHITRTLKALSNKLTAM